MKTVVILVALLQTAIAALSLTNGIVSVTFGIDDTLSTLTAPSEAGEISYNIAGDTWSASVSLAQGAPATILGPGVCTERSSTQSDTHVFVTYGGCSPYRVIVTYELQSGWRFATKTLLIQSEFEDTSFFVNSIAPVGFVRFTQQGASQDAPFVVVNPFDTSKHLGVFQRFPSHATSLFLTVQNPFTLFTLVSNHTTACTAGVDHPNGDEPNMPLSSPSRDPDDCAFLCSSDPDCKAYAFIDAGCRGIAAPVCYLKSSVTPAAAVPSCLCSGTRTDLSSSSALAIRAAYAPNMAWDAFPRRSPGIISDAVVFGTANLTAHHVHGGVLTAGERDAYASCVESFLLDTASRVNRTVKINVAWDENDYQIDVSTGAGQAQYRRIIDGAAALGLTHIVFEPQDSLQSSRYNATDAWGWESGLWMTMGEQVREGRWVPGSTPVPAELQALIDYAQTRNVKLCAYVYPVLAFAQSQEWLFEHDGRTWASLAVPSFQDWLSSTLISFLNVTGGGGFAWDYTFFVDSRPGNEYSQWRGWMNVINRIRQEFPDVVMDHRQLNHVYGPWYQLAGSYAEPIAGDENPETYGVLLPSLHTDHVAANNMRTVNYVYRDQQLQPAVRVPGFVFHQTERSDAKGLSWTDLYTRDFDYAGHVFSLLSSIATAGLNNVFAMIPARDSDESSLLPPAVRAFVRKWMAWTDANQDLLSRSAPIPTLAMPSLFAIDGTAAFRADGSRGAVFLFNPGPVPLSTTLVLDESLGLPNATRGATWAVTEEYPLQGQSWGAASHGESLTVSVPGSGVRVLFFEQLFNYEIQITNATGVAAYDSASKTLTITNLTGVAGWAGLVSVLFVPGSVDHVLVNGTAVRFLATLGPHGTTVRLVVTFAGGLFSPLQPIGDLATAARLAGPFSFQANFTLPPRVLAQWAARARAYPVPWTPEELAVSWLAPARPMLSLFFASPLDSYRFSLRVDGKTVAVTPAYNSRALPEARCFLGFFADLSSVLTTAGTHTLTLDMLSSSHAGNFVGLFMENVEYEYTNRFVIV